jgi:signal transduction histidine kinase/CheY-like chemotaxis protein
VLAVPLSSRGERIGVLLLGSLASLGGDAAAFAERAGGHLAIALQNAMAHRRVAAFAEELRDRNERLQAQNEELQAQGEEIQAQSEELHAQAAEIRRHNEDLASAQDALAAKAGALEEVDRRKNEFLATLGHELRNPLAAVATAGRLLQAEAPHGAASRHAAIVSRQVRHLRRLVDDLLDLSRINHGKIELRPERLDLVAVLDGAVHAILADAAAKRQHVSFRGGGAPLPVDGDQVRLEQVVSNLLRNALKYTPEGGTISVAVEVEAGDAVIRVGDTGVGIPPELLPRIFEPFIQGVHSEGGEQGLGLGLALVRRLVELHGGTVAARSDGAGTGTVFIVRLPLASGAARDAAAGREPLPAQDARLQILVVEDNPDVAESTSDALEMFGYAVRIEPDAEAGLRACIERPPDVALLDIGLPGRSGYDLARDIRARLPVSEVRLVAVTGYGQPEDRARSADAGFDHHLVKPVDLDELRGVIERLAAKKLVDAAA